VDSVVIEARHCVLTSANKKLSCRRATAADRRLRQSSPR